MVNDIQMEIEPDSGAEVNVMDELQYIDYMSKTQEKPELMESKTKIRTLQNTIDILGEFVTTVRNQTRGIQTKFVVVNGNINSPPLLGQKTLSDLGMIKISEEGRFKEPNELRVSDEQVTDNTIQPVSGSSTTKDSSDDIETACREATHYKVASRSSPSHRSYGWQKQRRGTWTNKAWRKRTRRGPDQTGNRQPEEVAQANDEWTLVQRRGRTRR